jgi:hypothetical protein
VAGIEETADGEEEMFGQPSPCPKIVTTNCRRAATPQGVGARTVLSVSRNPFGRSPY